MSSDVNAIDGSDLIEEFVVEALDSLQAVPKLLDSYRRDPGDSDGIHAAFRAIHSIKGCAACLGLDAYKAFAHSLEHTLADIRDGRLPLGEDLQHSLIDGVDSLDVMLNEALGGNITSTLSPAQEGLLKRIQDISVGSNADRPDEESLLGELEIASAFETASTQEKPTLADEPGENAPTEPARAGAKTRFVRVKEDRIDEFLEHVSSLFVTGELLKDLHLRMSDASQLAPLIEEFRQVQRDMKIQLTVLQRSVMALRRVSVSGLFSTFPRMARSLATQLGKKINVHVSGEDTEIDKSLAEDLDAALTHLIRNAVDHGIDTPDERRVRGMSESGNLWLRAEQVRNRVRISIRDDGRGIDSNRIRDKAVEKGIHTRSEVNALADEQVLKLIFHPGFSTAAEVSTVSGRGVGMDVVQTTMAKHNGEVTVESKVDVGTTLHLDIPIREAVLVVDGLLVRHAGQHFVLPFQHVLEIIEPGSCSFSSVQGRRVIALRGHTYDAISVSEMLDLDCDGAAETPAQGAALVGCEHGSICLLFDRIQGSRQVVVKGLDGILSGHASVSGVAQLGGGKLALVLNVPELIKKVTSGSRKSR